MQEQAEKQTQIYLATELMLTRFQEEYFTIPEKSAGTFKRVC